jgi:hypothetical protein
MVNANQHQLVDSVRGGDLALQCPAAGAETAYVAPAGDSVAWCWEASTAFNNAAGTNNASIASSGLTNTAAGFSIVEYTGTGANATVGHGLNNAPELIIVKSQTSLGTTNHFPVFSQGVFDEQGSDQALFLDTADGAFNAGFYFNSTAPTNQVFSLGTSQYTNNSGTDFVAYCWAPIPGYSAFGSYTGNNSTDGPFIYTGFRPAFIMYKRSNGTGSWVIQDTTRDTANPTNLRLVANTTNSEGTSTSMNVDILSNGFKHEK